MEKQELLEKGYKQTDKNGKVWQKNGKIYILEKGELRGLTLDDLFPDAEYGKTSSTPEPKIEKVETKPKPKPKPKPRPEPKKPDNKAIVPVETVMPFKKEYEDLTEITEEDFYSVWDSKKKRYKKEPNARVLKRWAREQKINTEIIQVEKNDTTAKAIIRGWIGNKTNPIMETCACVILRIKDYEREWLLSNLEGKEGRPRSVYANGGIRPRTIEDARDLAKYIVRKMIFAEREAVTKAKSIVYRELLGLEWREETEIEGEKTEIELVSR